MNPLVELQKSGQSFWYDNIRRQYLLDGTIQALIKNDGLRGMTSNPTIFEHAINAGDDYNEHISELASSGHDVKEIYEHLTITDIRMACGLFADLYEKTDGSDGYVSLEVSPHLAHDESRTVEEARRLFKKVNRPNVMIKVPATPEGIPAIRKLISEGINVNITLMFSQSHYESVAQAYIEGQAIRIANGADPIGIASVASFFVSRVDSAVDNLLIASNDPDAKTLLGTIAIANSKVVYRRFKEIFYGDIFEKQRASGAKVQRLLWASTSTKNPNYPDTKYVDQLIGPDTVNTMPPQTIEAFRDHGRVAQTLERDVEGSVQTLEKLAQFGIDLENVTEQLQKEGVDAFARSFDSLMNALSQKVLSLS